MFKNGVRELMDPRRMSKMSVTLYDGVELYASDKLLCYHNHRKQDKRDRFTFQAPKLQMERKKLSGPKPDTLNDDESMKLYELSQEQFKGEAAHST